MNKICTKCNLEKEVVYFSKHKKSKDGLQHRCKKCFSLMNKERYSSNPSRFKEYQKTHRKLNPLKVKENKKREYEKNKVDYLRRARLRQERLIIATPAWLTPEQKAHIERTYKLRDIISSATGIIYHVDHVVPIKGKNVCGLHVPWNLNVIPAKDNLIKHNKY